MDPFAHTVRLVTDGIHHRDPGKALHISFVQDRRTNERLRNAQKKEVRHIKKEEPEPGHPNQTKESRFRRDHKRR